MTSGRGTEKKKEGQEIRSSIRTRLRLLAFGIFLSSSIPVSGVAIPVATNAISALPKPDVSKLMPSLGGESLSHSQKIVQKALSWVDQEFAPGEKEQCANFVRSVLSSVGLSVGVTSQPVDGFKSNPSLANSFFGPDIGQVIHSVDELQPGDLVAFGGTYGGYSPSDITHVAIYVGDGEIVDRPTSSKPVQKRGLDTFTHFVAGVRLK